MATEKGSANPDKADKMGKTRTRAGQFGTEMGRIERNAERGGTAKPFLLGGGIKMTVVPGSTEKPVTPKPTAPKETPKVKPAEK
jgi:hypothetical protein